MIVDPKIIATKLRILRLNRNLSQSDVADILSVTPQLIVSVELGERNLSEDKLETLCKSIGLSMDYFFEEPIEGVPIEVQAELYLYDEDLTDEEKAKIIEIIKKSE